MSQQYAKHGVDQKVGGKKKKVDIAGPGDVKDQYGVSKGKAKMTRGK